MDDSEEYLHRIDREHPMWFNKAGEPISVAQWEVLHRDETYLRVASDHVGPDLWVSTVWLGIDHGFGRGHRPIIFETMIFGGSMDTECWRYATEAEAIAGHAEALNMARLNEQVTRELGD